MDGWMVRRVDMWIDGWLGGWISGRKEGWKEFKEVKNSFKVIESREGGE